MLAFRDRSTRLSLVSSEDETRQSVGGRALPPLLRPRTWVRWIANATRSAQAKPQIAGASSDHPSVYATLDALPTLLDGASLPNGVIELLIEDFEAPTRRLLDIHDGLVTLVEPGQCVPWACIAGPPTAWAKALGPERNTTDLQLTGDEPLARRVLAALASSG